MTDVKTYAETELAAHEVVCFCRVLHCQAVFVKWNLHDVTCFTTA